MRTYTTSAGTTARLKDASVDMEGTVPSAVDPIINAASQVYEGTPQRLVITSAADGTHMDGSKHYSGEALDLRIWHLPDPAAAAEELQRRLGDDYDVVYGPNHSTHIHVEYDPA
jgi:hypothetical protein